MDPNNPPQGTPNPRPENQPTPAQNQAPSAPTVMPENPRKPEIREEPKPVQKKKRGAPFMIFVTLIILSLVLVTSFYGLLLWSLFGGNVSNPLFEVFGIDAPNLKSILIQFTNGLFGIVCLVLLIAVLANVFRLMLTSKQSPMRKSLIRRVIVWFFLFILFVATFIFMYVLIDRADAVVESETDQSMILTNPPDLRNLQAPVTVNFDLKTRLEKELGSLDNVQQVTWDFDGDGKVDATKPEAAFRYIEKGDNNGVFTVKAVVRYINPATGKTQTFETQREVIISDVGVLADISANVEKGISPLTVEFTGSKSSDPDGNIIRYEWDFDDDNDYEIVQEAPAILEQTFSQIGEHIVRLRVTGTNNDSAVIEKVITVEGGRPTIEAKITSQNGLTGEAPFEVLLDGKNSFVESGVITKYEWIFDGEKSSVLGSTQKRVFRDVGEYKVTLTVENDLGERHRTNATIKVVEKSVKANIIINTDPYSDPDDVLYGNVPFDVEFDASSSVIKSPVDWEWDFDDDELPDEFGQKIEHTFREPGQYVVTLTIRDIKGRAAKTFKRIVVSRAGVRSKITADKLSGNMPLEVHFDGSGSSTDKGEVINYIWEFPGEDPVDYGAQISYLFRRVGTFPVKLTVISSNGETAVGEVFVSVRPPALVADFKMSPESGAAPLDVVFDPTPSQGVAREYRWDFGDGSTSSEFKPTHKYQEPGLYLVELKLVSNKGIVSKVEKRITITK
ncbi:MAG TPA: PKD domain-containing protein [Candidatus Gracilibacteria bacterium]